jgi:hypothetical protein
VVGEVSISSLTTSRPQPTLGCGEVGNSRKKFRDDWWSKEIEKPLQQPHGTLRRIEAGTAQHL